MAEVVPKVALLAPDWPTPDQTADFGKVWSEPKVALHVKQYYKCITSEILEYSQQRWGRCTSGGLDCPTTHD